MRTLLVALFFSLGQPALAADASKPHPHQGIAPKFTHPAPTALTATDQATLTAGQTVRKQIKYDSGGRGVAILDVHAPSDKVWGVITNFEAYPRWVDHMQEAEVYRRDDSSIYVRFKLKVFGMGVEYYIHHTWDRDAGALTWELDYSRTSDLDDSTGYWLVYPAPGRQGYTRVEYTVDLRLSGWVPGVVEDMLANQGLDKATGWVKQQAER